MKSITDLQVGGRVVLLRADLNVPLDGTVITDDGRIRASMPTITALAGRGARVLICAHLGRPGGDDYAARSAGGPSLRPVAARLGEGPARGRCWGGRCHWRATALGRTRYGWPARWQTPTWRSWRTCGSSLPRQARMTRGGRRSPDGWPRSPRCTSATGSARCTASTPA